MWFWRGTQSAIFYYVSLSPCLEWNHKRKRRKEANQVQQERGELELSEPGIIHQPLSFQTNQYWAEEIRAGPGPPRGWRGHSLHHNVECDNSKTRKGKNRKKSVFSPTPLDQPNEFTSSTTSSSHLTPQTATPQTGDIKPTMPSRRGSTAAIGSTLETLKDTLMSTIARPETWNWKRYDREDETLFGINDRISRIWDRATHHNRQSSAEPLQPFTSGRNRARTTDSDDLNWLYARNPGVNDLHPPIVSQLPRTEREVAWMMQPPPSRAVMEGKVRPGTEHGNRRALCTIGSSLVPPEKPDRPGDPNQDDSQSHRPTDKMWPPKTLISPGESEETAAVDADADVDDDDDDGEATDEEEEEEEDGAESTLTPDHHHHPFLLPSSFPPRPQPAPTSPLDRSSLLLLRRPPLALLLDSNNKSPTKFQSYQLPLPLPLPLPDPKLLNLHHHRCASPPCSWCSCSPEMDLLMSVVMPRIPERSRYSLPDVRVWEED